MQILINPYLSLHLLLNYTTKIDFFQHFKSNYIRTFVKVNASDKMKIKVNTRKGVEVEYLRTTKTA